MKILTIFFSSINKYGVKFLSLILVYEILNIYKLRLLDYFILNSVKKKLEPCVPSPYYCLSKIKKILSKSRNEIKKIVLGEIFIKKNLIKKFKIKKKKIHNLLNIYKFN